MVLLLSRVEIPSSFPFNSACSPATAWEIEIPGTPFTENGTGSAATKPLGVLEGVYGICEISLQDRGGWAIILVCKWG
jgi:hypothetical protein